MIDEAQRHVARLLRSQIFIAADLIEELLTAIAPAVAARLHHAAGTQHRIVVVALGVGDAARRIQLVERRRPEAFAVRATHHQLFERLITERVFRVGGAAEVAVFVVTHSGGQFEAVEHRHIDFGVRGFHAAVALDAAGRVDTEALDVTGKRLEILMEFLFAVLATQRQTGRPGTEPVSDLATDPPVETGHAADGGGVGAVVHRLIDVLLTGAGLRAERVEQTTGQTVDHRLIADIAAGDAGDDFVLVVRGADVVIPAADQTVEAQQKALAGVLVFRFPWAGGGFAPVHIDRLRRVEGEARGARRDAVAG